MLSANGGGGVHSLNTRIGQKTVREILTEKHPPAKAAQDEALLSGEMPPPPHPVIYSGITREAILDAVLNTQGAAGPSGMDAASWRRICTAFHGASNDLCDALAGCARRLASSYVDPASLDAFLACRLIPLDKQPGVRPIGVGEVVRRIIGKAILWCVPSSIQQSAGCLQLCGGQQWGIEAAIHAMRVAFEAEDAEGVLFADASNAFNRLNRAVCLHNNRFVCPTLAAAVINSYLTPSRLFVDGECLLSCEGTTQGDPLAMSMYALATVPLIQKVSESAALQSWYADDSTAVSTIRKLRDWWSLLELHGPAYGYYTNAPKSRAS